MLGLYYKLVYLFFIYLFSTLAVPVLAAAMLSAVKSLMVIWYYVEDVFKYVVVLYKYKILCNVLNTHKKNV